MLYLSPSALGVYRDCPTKYRNKYILDRVPVRKDPKLSFGDAWDGATGAFWQAACTIGHGLLAAVEWLKQADMPINAIDAAKLAALLKHYAPPTHLFEFVENQVRAELLPAGMRGVRLVNYCDTLLRHRETGRLVVRECKTTNRDIEGFGPYWQRLQIDSQLGAYWHAFGAYAIYYDVTSRPGIKPSSKDEVAAAAPHLAGQEFPTKKAAEEAAKAIRGQLTEKEILDAYQKRIEDDIIESPGKYYQFRRIEKTDADAEKAMADIVGDSCRLRDARRLNRWPRNSGHCINVYGTCPYIDVCSGRADLADPALFQDRERRQS